MRGVPSARRISWVMLPLLLGSAATVPESHPPAGRPPNLLVIVADDLGYSDLGAFGGEIDTRHIDGLARQGLLFTHFYTASTCSPTRAMLMTGVDHHRIGFGTLAETRQGAQLTAPGYEGRLDPDLPTIAELMRARGYRTSMAGKWHLGLAPEAGPHARGFDRSYAMTHGTSSHFDDGGYGPMAEKTDFFEDGRRFIPPAGFYSSDYFATRAIDFIDQALEADRPFFSYLAFTAPHHPLHAPPELVAKYSPRYEAGWDAVREARIRRLRALELFGEGVEPAARPDGIPAWSELTADERRFEARRMAVYAAMVERLDWNVGRVLEHLESRRALAETIVVVLSDNGAEASAIETLPAFTPWFAGRFDTSYDALGGPRSFQSYGPAWAGVSSLPFRLHKGVAAEGGVRSPLIVAGPGIAQGRREAAVTVADLAATLLALSGAVSSAGGLTAPDGISFTELLTAPRSLAEGRILHFESFGTSAAVLDGRWKALRVGRPWGDDRWRLHDLRRDPAELVDLSARQPQVLQMLVRSYETYAARNGVQSQIGPPIPWGFSGRFPATPASATVLSGADPLEGAPRP